MAKGVNRVFLLGNVGKDPEIRATPGGTLIANFTFATADRQKGSDGQWTGKTEWHNLVAFTRTAEIVRDYVKKGTLLFVEGKLQSRSWDDKVTKQKRVKTEILIIELSILGGGPHADKSTNETLCIPPPTSPTAPDYGDMEITDDDLPF